MTSRTANPFVGLRPFGSDDAHLYFGRAQQTRELLARLREERFVAVVGSSGCGKSSLVRAGLIPSLRAGFLVKKRDAWGLSVMKPGARPFWNLAAALAANGNGNPNGLAQRFREEGADAIEEHVAPMLGDSRSLLLVVDQFEEIFRFGVRSPCRASREEAADFVSVILALSEIELPLFVVLTMRSDFLDDCDAFCGLPEALNRGLYLVPRLTREQRRETILGPLAGRATIEPALVDFLLNEAHRDADELPVLEHALMRTWDRWRENGHQAIALAHYEAAGRLEGAIDQHAEEAFSALDTQEQGLLVRLFQALTETDANKRRIRRPARMSTLEAITGASSETIRRVLGRFRDNAGSFLSWVDDEADPLVDISHESLIRGWKKLRTWVEEEEKSETTYRRLAEAAILHARGEGGLYQDPALQNALEWLESRRPTEPWAQRVRLPEVLQGDRSAAAQLFPQALQFLEESRAVRDAGVARRAEDEATARRWRRGAGVGATLLAAGLLVFVPHAIEEAKDEKLQKKHTDEIETAFRSLSFATKSSRLVDVSPRGSLFLAGLALQRARQLRERRTLLSEADVGNTEGMAEAALRAAIGRLSAGVPLAVQKEGIAAVALSHDDRWLALATTPGDLPPEEQVLRIWDLRQSPPTESRLADPEGLRQATNRLHLAVGVEWLAVARDRNVWLRRLGGDPAPHRDPLKVGEGSGDSVSALALSPDDRWLAAGTMDGKVRLFDLRREGGSRPVVLPVTGAGAVTAVRISRDSRRLAIVAGSSLSVWRLGPASPRPVAHHFETVSALDFDVDGLHLVVASSKGLSSLSLSSRGSAPRESLIVESTAQIDDVKLSPDGRWLAVRTIDGSLRLLSANVRGSAGARAGSALGVREPGQPFLFTSNGGALLTAGADGIVRRWALPLVNGSVASLDGQVSAVALSPDLTWQAVGTTEGAVRAVGIETERGKERVTIGHGEPFAGRTNDRRPAGALVASVQVSPRGRWVASLTASGAPGRSGAVYDLALWPVKGVGELGPPQSAGKVYGVEFSPDEQHVLVRPGEGAATLRELTPRGLGDVALDLGPEPLERVLFARDGRHLVTKRASGLVQLWNLQARAPESVPPLVLRHENEPPTSALAIAADGGWLALGTATGDVRVWDIRGSEPGSSDPEPPPLAGGNCGITAIAMEGRDREDGTRGVVTVDEAGIVRRYRLPTLRERAPSMDVVPEERPAFQAGLWSRVRVASLSADGSRLLLLSESGTLRLWSVGQDAPQAQAIDDPQGAIAEAAFRSDGRDLVTVTRTGGARSWSLDPAELLAQARALAGRNLSEKEWARLLPGLPPQKVFPELP